MILEVVPLFKGPGTGGALPALHPILGYDLADVPLHNLLIICNTDINIVSFFFINIKPCVCSEQYMWVGGGLYKGIKATKSDTHTKNCHL
jgi:hypothetical protein